MRSQVILILLGIVAVAVGLAACESVDNGPSEADVQASYYEVPTAEEAAALLGAQFEKVADRSIVPARDFAGEGFDAVDEDLLETNSTSCDATAFVHQPYILGVTKHSVRIVWRTDYAGDSTIEYGPTPSLGTEIEAGVFGRNHVTEIGGLEPETPYYYKVSTCGVESAVFPFRTAPERNTPFTFAVLGDNRSDPASYATVAAGIADAAPDIILNTGDIVADGWRKEQFEEQFFGPVGDLYSETPVFVSIGNHEGESPYHYSRFPYKNSRAGYYAFRYGNTLFISLNTNRLYLPGTPQYDWLVRVLSGASARTAEWIVVFAHHPAWSEGWDSPGYSGEWLLRYTVVPVLEQYGVDLYFCGHTHDYERGLRNGVTHIISGGGGSALDSFQQDIPHVVVSQFRYHFVNVSVDGDSLTLDATDPDGTVFDSITLTH